MALTPKEREYYSAMAADAAKDLAHITRHAPAATHEEFIEQMAHVRAHGNPEAQALADWCLARWTHAHDELGMPAAA